MEFHALANVFPLLEGGEFDKMVEDIRENGLNHDITTYEGKILEGRNRYRACIEARVEPRYTPYTGTTPAQFVWSENVVRRQLKPSQKALAAEALIGQFEIEALARMHQGRPSQEAVTNSSQDNSSAPALPEPKKHYSRSREYAAQVTGVGSTLVGQARQLKKEAKTSPRAADLLGEVQKGKRTLNSALKDLGGRAAPPKPPKKDAPPPKTDEESRRLTRGVTLMGQLLGGIERDWERAETAPITDEAFNEWWDEVDELEWKQTLKVARWFATDGQPLVDWVLARAKQTRGNTPPRVANRAKDRAKANARPATRKAASSA